jgi:hypothetical protein
MIIVGLSRQVHDAFLIYLLKRDDLLAILNLLYKVIGKR